MRYVRRWKFVTPTGSKNEEKSLESNNAIGGLSKCFLLAPTGLQRIVREASGPPLDPEADRARDWGGRLFFLKTVVSLVQISFLQTTWV